MLKILFCLLIKSPVRHLKDFPDGSVIKNPPANAADMGSIPGQRSPKEGNGNPLQYSCLGNPMDRGAWRVQSIGSQRVRLDLVTQHAYKTFKIVQRSFEKLGVYGQLIKIR